MDAAPRGRRAECAATSLADGFESPAGANAVDATPPFPESTAPQRAEAAEEEARGPPAEQPAEKAAQEPPAEQPPEEAAQQEQVWHPKPTTVEANAAASTLSTG